MLGLLTGGASSVIGSTGKYYAIAGVVVLIGVFITYIDRNAMARGEAARLAKSIGIQKESSAFVAKRNSQDAQEKESRIVELERQLAKTADVKVTSTICPKGCRAWWTVQDDETIQ